MKAHHSNNGVWLTCSLVVAATVDSSSAFSNLPRIMSQQAFVGRPSTALQAAPQRLEENTEGVVYVNDKVRRL